MKYDYDMKVWIQCGATPVSSNLIARFTAIIKFMKLKNDIAQHEHLAENVTEHLKHTWCSTSKGDYVAVGFLKYRWKYSEKK